MRLKAIIGAICGLAASAASAQPREVANCGDFLAANAGQRAEAIRTSWVWTAGFTQAKVLSCAAAMDLPRGAVRDRLERVECGLRDAGNRLLAMPAAEWLRRIEDSCRRSPDNDMSMTLLLLLADINRTANAQP